MTSMKEQDSICSTIIIGPAGVVDAITRTASITFGEEVVRRVMKDLKAHHSTRLPWVTKNVTFRDTDIGVQALGENTYLIKHSTTYSIEVITLRKRIISFWRNIKKKLIDLI